jgi:hypothetical protein
MKPLLVCYAILFLGLNISMAQQKRSITPQYNTSSVPKGSKQLNLAKTRESKRYTLSNASAHSAYAEPTTSMKISDPVINLLNAKAGESPYTIDKSSLIGVPSGTYGFANGKISLYQVGATSTGTSTGSGSVGTGSSPGGIGTLSPFMGINGKSPYTGSGPYGTRLTQQKTVTDSTRYK